MWANALAPYDLDPQDFPMPGISVQRGLVDEYGNPLNGLYEPDWRGGPGRISLSADLVAQANTPRGAARLVGAALEEYSHAAAAAAGAEFSYGGKRLETGAALGAAAYLSLQGETTGSLRYNLVLDGHDRQFTTNSEALRGAFPSIFQLDRILAGQGGAGEVAYQRRNFGAFAYPQAMTPAEQAQYDRDRASFRTAERDASKESAKFYGTLAVGAPAAGAAVALAPGAAVGVVTRFPKASQAIMTVLNILGENPYMAAGTGVAAANAPRAIIATERGVAMTPELLSLQGTSKMVGDFRGIAGARVEEIISRVPKNWTLLPQQKGMGIRFLDSNGIERLRLHGPSVVAPAGSNSASGWTVRVHVSGTKNGYYDNLGNIVGAKANEGHIPIYGNPNAGL